MIVLLGCAVIAILFPVCCLLRANARLKVLDCKDE